MDWEYVDTLEAARLQPVLFSLLRYTELREGVESAAIVTAEVLEELGGRCVVTKCTDSSGEVQLYVVTDHTSMPTVGVDLTDVFDGSDGHDYEVFTWDGGGAWQEEEDCSLHRMRKYLTSHATQAKVEVLHNTFEADRRSAGKSGCREASGEEGASDGEDGKAPRVGGDGCLRKWSKDCCPPMSSVTVTCVSPSERKGSG